MSDFTKSPHVIETTDAAFEADVFTRSHEVTVVVDFWADWCQPCKALAPILEKLVDEAGGKLLLVKAETEVCQQAAASFNVTGIPAVYAVQGGEVIDFFQGVLPEPQLRQWLEHIQPSEADLLLAEAKRLQASDPAAAEEKFQAAIAAADNDTTAQVAFAEFLMEQDRLAESREILQPLHAAGFTAQTEDLLQAVELKLAGQEAGDVDACRAASEADPDDLSLRLNLARAEVAAGQHKAALQTALSIVQADHGDHRDQARQIMLGVFNLLPDDSELISDYRRKLSMALY